MFSVNIISDILYEQLQILRCRNNEHKYSSINSMNINSLNKNILYTITVNQRINTNTSCFKHTDLIVRCLFCIEVRRPTIKKFSYPSFQVVIACADNKHYLKIKTLET